MRFIITSLLFLLSLSAQAQYFWAENFEAPTDAYRDHFFIDTSYHHNIWQIGRPHKHTFDSMSAYSFPNVIITDTTNPYSAHDTSVFIVSHYMMFSTMLSINFRYKLDIDSNALAKFEISGDRGLNWINPLTEDTTYMFYWGYGRPRLDTATAAWIPVSLNLDPWESAIAGGSYVFPHYRTSDTVLFRFTFISDTNSAARDGWMMDNFFAENAIMEGGVKKYEADNIVSVYPVPAGNTIFYHSNELSAGSATIVIYDISGKEVFKRENAPASDRLNVSLPDGNYMLRFSNGNNYALKKIVIAHQ